MLTLTDGNVTMRPTPNAQRPTPNVNSCPKSDDTIHVAFGISDPKGTYSQHAGVVMTSIFENTHSKITVHIIHDDTLTKDNRRKFIRTAEKYSQRVEFHDVTEYRPLIEEKQYAYFPYVVGTLYILLIPDVINTSKVIYFDCDIIVNLDVAELWNADTENCCIAGVQFLSNRSPRAGSTVRSWLMGCSAKTYINSGVVVMNIPLIREKGSLLQRSLKWMERYAHLMLFADQDILNGLFHGSIKLLDSKFNFLGAKSADRDFTGEGSIIHLAGPHNAAWEIEGFYYQRLYWKYYLHSAWGENKSSAELIDAISSYAKVKSAEKNSLWVRFKKRSRQLRLLSKYVLSEIFYRAKFIFARR